MLKILSLSLFLMSGISASFSTDVIVYTYDNAGNRLAREVSVTPVNVSSRSMKDSTHIESKFQILDNRIVVSPNPTDGKFSVEILSDTKTNIISVHSIYGTLIHRVLNQNIADFDLSGHVSGIYIVTVEINGEKQVIKIIKK
ncbi:MAG: T9SS type A sorting domain-containing protein [Muribaculaceae bacterium]|nr:T9SS type A sorting domain-containing protein [Muribaculaceae bacterium]